MHDGLNPQICYTFSILGRIGGDATEESTMNAIADIILSVSSVGSEAMQLAAANPPEQAAGGSFSILGRIGGDATAER